MKRGTPESSLWFPNSGSPFAFVDATPITATPLTIAYWIKRHGVSQTQNQTIAAVKVKASASAINVWSAEEIVGSVLARAGSGVQSATSIIPERRKFEWSFVCGTFASTTSRQIWLNGASGPNSTTSRVPATNPDSITVGGKYASSTPSEFVQRAALSEVSIWNVALTESQIKALYAGAHPRDVRGDALQIYYPLDGDGKNYGVAGSAYNLTIQGSAVFVPGSGRASLLRRKLWHLGSVVVVGGTIGATESTDTAALTTAIWRTAQIVATESTDTATLTTTVTTGGAVGATESADTATLTAANWRTAQIVATESTDVSAIAVSVTTGAAVGALESSDAAAIAAANWRTAQIAGQESPDTAAITGSATTGASIAAIEGADAAAIAAVNWRTAAIAGAEASDVAAIAPSATTGAAIAAAESGDTAAITAASVRTGTILAAESGDTVAITGAAGAAGAIAATESSDTAALLAAAWRTAQIAGQESADTAAITGSATTGASIAGGESGDTCGISATAQGTTQGSIAATEGADRCGIVADAGEPIPPEFVPKPGLGLPVRRAIPVGRRIEVVIGAVESGDTCAIVGIPELIFPTQGLADLEAEIESAKAEAIAYAEFRRRIEIERDDAELLMEL